MLQQTIETLDPIDLEFTDQVIPECLSDTVGEYLYGLTKED
jgi:hypothetical protein